MNGTEKQVAWAQDIIRDARDTITNNIKTNEERFAAQPEAEFYRTNARIWKKVSAELEAALAKIADKDAKYYIDNRYRMDGDAMRKRATDLRFWYEKHPEHMERDLIYLEKISPPGRAKDREKEKTMNDTLRYTISGMLASGTDRDYDRISGIILAVNELTGENWNLICTGSIWYVINYKDDDRIDAARSMDDLANMMAKEMNE